MSKYSPVFLILFGLVSGMFFGLMIAESVFSTERQYLDIRSNNLARIQREERTNLIDIANLQIEYYHKYAILLVKVDHFTDAIQAWNKSHPEHPYLLKFDEKYIHRSMGL